MAVGGKSSKAVVYKVAGNGGDDTRLELLQGVETVPGMVNAIALAPNQSFLATGGESKVVELFYNASRCV